MENFHDSIVQDIMQKNLTRIKESASLIEAIKIMDQKKISALIVEKEHPKDSYGIITRKDVIVEAAENWEAFPTLHVFDLATKPLIMIPADVGIKHAIRLMRLPGVRRLAVYQNDDLAGVVSNTDIFNLIVKQVKKG